MSDKPSYTFHAVGAENEPKHYELRDSEGRVVCKGFITKNGASAYAGGSLLIKARVGGYTLTELEEIMRDTLNY